MIPFYNKFQDQVNLQRQKPDQLPPMARVGGWEPGMLENGNGGIWGPVIKCSETVLW